MHQAQPDTAHIDCLKMVTFYDFVVVKKSEVPTPSAQNGYLCPTPFPEVET